MRSVEADSIRTVKYGDRSIDYSLSFSKRKTLSISVYPDGRVIVRAPFGVSLEDIEARVTKKSGWIIKHLDHFESFRPLTPRRLYVSGETHLYLGKNYRLTVIPDIFDGVKLKAGRFEIHTNGVAESGGVRELLEAWYLKRAKVQFRESVKRCWPPFGAMDLPMPSLRIRRMKTRWGSLSSRGSITLNLDLIRAPMDCIDYVTIHELCHLVHLNHGAGFYRLLESILPCWKETRARLESTLAS